jgi:hypothetical protein
MDRHVSYMGELRNAYKGLGVKLKGKKLLWRHVIHCDQYLCTEAATVKSISCLKIQRN